MIKKKKGYLWNKDKFFAEEQTEAEQTKPEAEIIEKKYKYVILGTGIPSLIAIDQIREKDKENEVKNISIFNHTRDRSFLFWGYLIFFG